MKRRISFFVLFAVNALLDTAGLLGFIPSIITGTVGAFSLSFGIHIFSALLSISVWKTKISVTGIEKLLQLLAFLMGLLGGFSFIRAVFFSISSLKSGKLVPHALSLLCFSAFLCIAPILAKAYLEKVPAEKTTALALEALPLFKSIDANIPRAKYFIVSYDGIALFSDSSYCFELYRYADVGLSELSSPQEVAMVGSYFTQKYNKEFTCRACMRRIPCKAGKTVSAIGSDSLDFGRLEYSRDKMIFKSYVFSRK